jgi:hypothetical protein
MTGPWPDIAHTYDVAAEHYAATFAGELAGKPFDRDLPRPRIPVALAEFHRVLRPGGAVLAAMHGGAGETGSDAAFGFPVPVRATLVSLEEITAMAEAAGFTVKERHERAPYPGEYPSRRVYLWAQTPLAG